MTSAHQQQKEQTPTSATGFRRAVIWLLAVAGSKQIFLSLALLERERASLKTAGAGSCITVVLLGALPATYR
jgi:hypothetical protein